MVFLNIAGLYGPIAFRQPRSGSVLYFLFVRILYIYHTHMCSELRDTLCFLFDD